MKIGFLQIVNQKDINQHYPLGFAYLTGHLRNNLSNVIETVWLDSESIENDDYSIDILCVSCISQDFDDLDKTVSSFKKKYPDVTVILGGNHITNFPHTLPETVDIGVIGEGEITFLELIKSWLKNRKFLIKDLQFINGIIYKESNGKIKHTPSRTQNENLDDIGLPDRSIFPDSKKALYLLTSRGCPYKCSFCSSSLFWKKTRYFSADYIANDIEAIIEQSPETNVIGIWDDLFISNKTVLTNLSEKLKERKLLSKIKLHTNIRANLISEEMCILLHRLNVCGASFGFESACERSLQILKTHISVDQNFKALDLLKQFNFSACCSFVFGVPGETEDEARLTFDTIIDIVSDGRLIEPHLNILMPMPNTIFWKQAEEKGLLSSDKNMQWNRLRYYASYLDSTFDTPEEWAHARLKNKSIYLNEEYLKEDILLGLIVDYEKKIKKIREKISLTQRIPYLYFAHVDSSIPNNAHSFILNKVDNNSVVLECGSSGGHFTKVLAEKNCMVDCIENDRTVANMAYQYTQNIFMEDMEDENFLKSISSKKYDYVLFADVLEHLKNPDKCLLALMDKLKDDGKVIVSLPNIAHGSIRLKLLKGNLQHEDSGLLDKTHLHFYEFNSIVELLNRAGICIEQIDMVRIPVDHELSRINIDEFDQAIVDEIKKDQSSDVFQYVVTGTKFNGQQKTNDIDLLYTDLFGPKTEIFVKKNKIDNIKNGENIVPAKRNIRKIIKWVLSKK